VISNSYVLPEVMEVTLCQAPGTYYLAFYENHVVAISGIEKNQEGHYTCDVPPGFVQF